MIAAFARRRRESPSSAQVLDDAHRVFNGDWETLRRIAVDDEINQRVDVLVQRHPLRGADSIHLASALLLRDLLQSEVTFACADGALVAAAKQEGLPTSP